MFKAKKMKTRLFRFLSMFILFQIGIISNAQQLVHYWNFNDNTNLTTLLTPSISQVSGASITHIPGGISAIDVAGGTGQNFNVMNHNARNGDVSGTHLRFNDPIGGELEFALPTTGYEEVVVKFASRRSGSGAGTQTWSYSTDGTNFTFFATINPFNGDPALETLDFTSITTVNNNPNFKLRVSFSQGSGGTVGNNRFDNFTLDAYPIGGSDIIPPTVIFDPLNATNNVAVNIHPTLTFNEPVRLINNTALNNSNAATVVELRLNDGSGVLIPFTTTYTGNTITIIPDVALLNNQQYYIALLANSIEDMSDNAIVSIQSAQFTTISLQTQFNAGDMVIVAYRMNATATEDEIALLTLVDIIPGTFINLTDSKYTTNPQAQCPSGIVWTAPATGCIPAGTVIYIQTSALVANIGTVTGASFGLSSSGDQVIVYTGTASNPNYITALTSIDWISSNTNCGGSLSMIPVGLVDGVSALNTSTAPGNVSGNAVNAYYNGSQTGTFSQIRNEVLNPLNWIAIGGGTAPQAWPLYSFPSPPTVSNASVTNSTTIQLVFNTDLNITSAQDINNYTGIVGVISAVVTNNGTLNDTVTLTYSSSFLNGNNYTLHVNNILNASGILMACGYTYNFTYNTAVSFTSNFIVVEENHGVLNLSITLENPSNCSVDLVVLPAPHSTADVNDFTLLTQTLIFTGASSSTQVISIPIMDDATEEQVSEYFVLQLQNNVNCSINGDPLATIYIRDNDRQAPTPNNEIDLVHVTSFDPSGVGNSTCEVVAYDVVSKRLFATSAVTGLLDIIDFTNPAAPVTISTIDINPYGGITSVAVSNGIVAVASPNLDEQLNGSVVFLDINGNFINQLTVGALPDMITFSPDGNKVLTANEGQPNNAYTIDPEGSVSIIDLTPGIANLTAANVNTIYFTNYNAQEAALIASGVRKLKATSTLSQDFEPEYITVDPTSTKAWVTLQENNAIAEIDLINGVIADLWAMGTKDFNAFGNGFDASDNNNQILIANWPVKAFYIPDAIANFQVAGVNYIITANEGDEKEYAGLNERTTVGAASYILDPVAFPNANVLKKSYNLGRMRVTTLNGDTDNDGDYDEIYCVGSRSFSIFNADNKTLVFDSKDDIEFYTATEPSINALFNSDHEANAFKGRSRSKGPEPEGVTTASICGRIYAFISLERIGGVLVYDVTDPLNVKFVNYKNTRSTSTYSGDHGPETLRFISKADSPDGQSYLIVANEISGTLTIFRVDDLAPALIVNTSASICQGQSITFGSQTLNTAGNFSEIFINQYGCDSLVNLSLSLLPNSSGIDVVSSCTPISWIDGITYSSNNSTAFHLLPNAASNGCDSTVTLNFTITNINSSVNLTGSTLTAAQNGATYQWIDCNNGNQAISGATGQSFTPTVDGNYAVIITIGACSSTSSCMNVIGTALTEQSLESFVRVYPNPNNGQFFIEVNYSTSVHFFDALGRNVYSTKIKEGKESISLDMLPDGIYFLQAEVNGKTVMHRIIISR